MNHDDDSDSSAEDALTGWGSRAADRAIEAHRGSTSEFIAADEFQEAQLGMVLDMRRAAVSDDLEEYTSKQDVLASQYVH